MEIFILIIAFALAITIHEMSHAWMADRLGDPTARLAGRLSLNPLVHYDPIGSTLLVITVILTYIGALPFPFGWAKPVQIDPYNLRNPQKDSAIISLAGPLANIALAVILAISYRIFQSDTIFNLFYPVILLNISLAIFNLIPVHPLDGGKVLVGLLSPETGRQVDLFLNRYGLILLFLLIIPTFGGNSILSLIINPIIGFVMNILLPGAAMI
jgi:Zn-dependent protease